MDENNQNVLAQQEIAPCDNSSSFNDDKNIGSAQDSREARPKNSLQDDKTVSSSPHSAKSPQKRSPKTDLPKRSSKTVFCNVGKLFFQHDFFALSGTRKIAYMAILAALAVVAKTYLSITVGVARISFFYLPVFIAGSLFGPLMGVLTATVGDLIGATIIDGSPAPLYTLGSASMGLILGVSFYLKGKPVFKMTLGAVLVLFITSYGINTYAQSLWIGLTWWQTLFYGFPPRIALQPIGIAVNTALAIPVYHACKRYLFSNR